MTFSGSERSVQECGRGPQPVGCALPGLRWPWSRYGDWSVFAGIYLSVKGGPTGFYIIMYAILGIFFSFL